MHGSDEQPEGAAPTDDTGVGAELLDRLRPYLAESIMVLDADWRVKANLAPPGGLIGRGLGLGLHTLEDMHPDDAITVMDLGMQAFATEPGWTGSTVVRMCRGDDSYGHYEISATNRFDDPVIDGMALEDYKVRIIDGHMGTAAKTRVLIVSGANHATWSTVGVSFNIIEASWRALVDSVEYFLLREGVTPPSGS